jgi:hypothetical protein
LLQKMITHLSRVFHDPVIAGLAEAWAKEPTGQVFGDRRAAVGRPPGRC